VSDWVWVDIGVVLAAHDQMLADYGGSEGVGDMGGLEGALGRPLNLAVYGEPDAAELAALYAVGITKAHAFVDGNKRTAWTTAAAFLELNGYDMEFEEATVPLLMLAVARGDVDLAAMTEWFRARVRAR